MGFEVSKLFNYKTTNLCLHSRKSYMNNGNKQKDRTCDDRLDLTIAACFVFAVIFIRSTNEPQ